MAGLGVRDRSEALEGAGGPASMRWDLRDRVQFDSFFEFCFPRVLALEMTRLGDQKRAEEGAQSVLEGCTTVALRRGGEICLVDVLRRLRARSKASPPP